MILEVYTAATIMPVSTEEAAAFVRVNEATELAILEMAIKAATRKAQAITGRRLLTTVLDLKLSAFPRWTACAGLIELPETPVQSVTSVAYYDQDNSLQTLTVDTDYLVLASEREGAVYLPNGAAWPSTYVRPDAVRIRYSAGWASAALVPEEIRLWILQAVATMYECREHTVTGTIVGQLPRDFALGLLDGETTLRVR